MKTAMHRMAWRRLLFPLLLISLLLFSSARVSARLGAGKVLFLIGEQEYETQETLAQFASEELAPLEFSYSFASANPEDPNDFPGVAELGTADLLVISVRRRTPKADQMALIRKYIESGKPIVAIRTASHAFDREPPDAGHIRWEHFDNEILGGDYQGHYGNKPPYDPPSGIRVGPSAARHRIIKGIEAFEFKSTSHLYKNRQMAKGVSILMTGQVMGSHVVEPVSWTYKNAHGGRVFYTSLGNPDDFTIRPFRMMLLNAMHWAMGKSTPGKLAREGWPQLIELELQTRRLNSGKAKLDRESVPASKIGIVAIDMWNWHWCKTSTMRVAAMVPRMNRVLGLARKMGMQVFWCPTDSINAFSGTHQREIAVATTPMALPSVAEVDCPPARDGGGCTCGNERCQGNFGWDGMHPDIFIHENDLMPNDPAVLYAICKQRGITHLIYMGVHTQVCVLGKSVGVANMMKAGLNCILARDLTDAHGVYKPAESFTPDDLTQEVVAHFETHLLPTINFADELHEEGLWNKAWVVDPVRITPWGTPQRPHLFEEELTVTLTAPLSDRAAIFYTTDGSTPTVNSTRYLGPLTLNASTRIRANAFEQLGFEWEVKGPEGPTYTLRVQPLCLESEAYFARLEDAPPAPDVYISDLEPVSAIGPGHSYRRGHFRIEPFVNPPQKDRSNRGAPLLLRGKTYQKGMGVHAVNQLVYSIQPEYSRFVARVGIDEEMIATSHGSNLAMHPSVIFRVFIDGRLRAESPVMRVTEEPWRFNVAIPGGSKLISLAATDAGDGTKGDFANWVDAGFVVER